MLRLADTSIRMYRKGDDSVALRLRSSLMVAAKGQGFRLSTYLSNLNCTVTLATGEIVEFTDISYTEDCWHELDTMVHEFWAAASTRMESIRNTVGNMRLSYTLHSQPNAIELIVPVLARGTTLSRLSKPLREREQHLLMLNRQKRGASR